MRLWSLFLVFVAIVALCVLAMPASAGDCNPGVRFVPAAAPQVNVFNVQPRPANAGFSIQSNRRGTQVQSFGGSGNFSFQEQRGRFGRVRSVQAQGSN